MNTGKPTPPEQTDRRDLSAAFRDQLQAMVDGDTEVLDDLPDDGFTLTHMTGYVQPKAEWLAQMRAGKFIYHTVEERAVTIEVDGVAARLVGQILTDATVYGSRATWRLQLTLDYRRSGHGWTALRSVATTW
jgi:hypothetical protein